MNFDAKIRRQSIDPDDLLIAHVASMDACARGLLIAEKIITDGKLDAFVEARYSGWSGKEGRAILAEAAPPNLHVEPTMLDAARRAVELAA